MHNDRMTRRAILARAGVGAVAVSGLPMFLAACGGDDSTSSGARADQVASGGTGRGPLDFLGFEGDDAKDSKAMQAFLKDRGLELKSTYMGGPEEPIERARSGRGKGTDVIDVPVFALERGLEIGEVFAPMDPAKLPNLGKLATDFAGKDAAWYRDGQLYGVPYSLTPFCLLWDRERVDDPPTAWQDLADPRWKGRLGVFGDPFGHLSLVQHILKLGDPGKLPKGELGRVEEFTKRIVDNAKSVSPAPGDVINQLASGEIDTVWLGWSAFAVFAAGGGKDTIEFDLEPRDGSVTAISVYAIGNEADNAEGAYAYIDASLTPEVNGQLAAFIGGVPTVEGALDEIPAEARKTVEGSGIQKAIREYPQIGLIPTESAEFVTQGEWLETWTQLTGA